MEEKNFFIIGVNGVGKTTILGFLRKSLPADGRAIHDFDERGVPDNAGKDWRKSETKYWLELGAENKKNGEQTIVCGFAKPEEIEEASRELPEKPRVILLDADAKTIADRIKSRYLTGESTDELMRTTGKSVEKFVMDNIYYSNFLRESCLERGCEIINTTGKTPEEVANEILSVIRGKGGSGRG